MRLLIVATIKLSWNIVITLNPGKDIISSWRKLWQPKKNMRPVTRSQNRPYLWSEVVLLTEPAPFMPAFKALMVESAITSLQITAPMLTWPRSVGWRWATANSIGSPGDVISRSPFDSLLYCNEVISMASSKYFNIMPTAEVRSVISISVSAFAVYERFTSNFREKSLYLIKTVSLRNILVNHYVIMIVTERWH
jgi:hypothetical protein